MKRSAIKAGFAAALLLSGALMFSRTAKAQTNSTSGIAPAPSVTHVTGSVFIVLKNAQNIKLALAPIYVINEPDFKLIEEVAEPAVAEKIKDLAVRYFATQLKLENNGDPLKGRAEIAVLDDQIKILERVKEVRADIYFAAFPDAVAKSDADGRFNFTFTTNRPVVVAARSKRTVGAETEHYFWAFRFQPTGQPEQIMFCNDNFMDKSNMLQSFETFDKEVARLRARRNENIRAARLSQQAQAAEKAANARAANANSSLKWNIAQAGKGDAFGQFRMGERHRDGDGVEKDLAKARDYFNKSAAQGNTDAAKALEKLK